MSNVEEFRNQLNQFQSKLDDHAGNRSELSKNAKNVGRKLAHLPD